MSSPQLSAHDAAPPGWLARGAAPAGDGDLFEATLLFSDMRGSSDLVTRMAPRDFFRLLNGSLSGQADCIGAFGGEVVKYTGDGVMAVFRGSGRASLAIRCALALAQGCDARDGVPFGIGLAEGPVLAGFVGPDGPAERRHYDVIGAAVHLAARLCALAGPGEVLATCDVGDAVPDPALPSRRRRVSVPGFADPIACVAFARAQ